MTRRLPVQCKPREISYSITEDGQSITFFPCYIVSHNPHDVSHRYCAHCDRFMDLVELARELTMKYEIKQQ